MQRLTKKFRGHAHGAEGRSAEHLTGNYCRGEFEATACVERLAEYEDTGLTPEQILTVKNIAVNELKNSIRENENLFEKLPEGYVRQEICRSNNRMKLLLAEMEMRNETD